MKTRAGISVTGKPKEELQTIDKSFKSKVLVG